MRNKLQHLGMSLLTISIATTSLFGQYNQDKEGRAFLPIPSSLERSAKKQRLFSTASTAQLSIPSSGVVVGGDAWTGPNYAPGAGLVSIGDVNGDGKGDLMQRFINLPILDTPELEDYHQVQYELYFGDLSSPSQIITEFYMIYPVGDLNDDGFNDAIFRSTSDNDYYSIAFGSVNGYQHSAFGFGFPPINFQSYKSGDFNDDGFLDVLFSANNAMGGTEMYLLKGNAQGEGITLQPVNNEPAAQQILAFHRISDNKDYVAALIRGVSTVEFSIASIDTDGNWTEAQYLATGLNYSSVDYVDVAQASVDSELDIVVRINGESNLHIISSDLQNGLFNPTPVFVSSSIAVNQLYVVGDLNGDGSSDLLAYNSFDINQAKFISGSTISDGISESDLLDLGLLGAKTGIAFANNHHDATQSQFSFGDIVNLGTDDVIVERNIASPSEFLVQAASLDANSEPVVINLNAPVRQQNHEYIYNANAGDWDGDGIDDFAYLKNVFGPGSHVFIKKSSGGEIQFNFTDLNFFGVPTFEDMNGDGLPEMIIRIRRHENDHLIETVDVYSASSTNQTDPMVTIRVADRFPNSPNMVLLTFQKVGDVTGDGKPDLVATSGNGENKSYLMVENNGSYSFSPIQAWANSAGSIGDINYDGINDFVVNDFNTSSVRIFLGEQNPSSSTEFFPYQEINQNNLDFYTPGSFSAFAFRVETGDYNGDGYHDIATTVFNSYDAPGSSDGSYYLWIFDGYDGGVESFPSNAFVFDNADFAPFTTNSSFPTQLGEIQTLPDLNGDGSDELLVSTMGSFYITNAMILMGGLSTGIELIDYEMGDFRVLLEAPNQQVGLGVPAFFINAGYSVAVGDFDNDGVLQVVLPQYQDGNFQSNPQYNYDLMIPEVEIPAPIEITMIEDVEDDQGGWVRIHVDGFLFDEEFLEEADYRPDWVIWRKNAVGEWVHVSTIPYVENAAKYAEVSVPKTVPTGTNPDASTSYEFMVSSFWGEYKSESMIGYALDNIAPNQPSGMRAISQTNTVLMEWNPVLVSDLLEYAVYQIVDGERSTTDLGRTTSNELVIDKQALSGTNVELTVIAIDKNNNESVSTQKVNVDITTSSESFGMDVPTTFALRQNYPNPFNPSTTIKFDVPEQAHVKINVFDVMGRRVATLVDQNMSAGYHSIAFDASRLASGTYIYTFESDKGTRFTQRMTLVK